MQKIKAFLQRFQRDQRGAFLVMFGLIAIEAMACGTPVITTPFGAAPEIVVDGGLTAQMAAQR